MFNYADNVGIITGGVGRLGKTFAQALEKNGNKVYLFDIVDNCDFENENIKYMKVNITDEDEVISKDEEIYKKEKRIDIMIKNEDIQ